MIALVVGLGLAWLVCSVVGAIVLGRMMAEADRQR